MNDLVSKIKNFDYKSFALKHGEKAGLSLVIFFTLLALYNTAWSTIKDTPEELVKRAATAMRNLTTAPWPDEQKQQFVVENLMKQAKDMENTMRIDKFAYNVPFTSPLYPRMQPAEQPKVLVVESAIADPGLGAFPLRAPPSEAIGAPQPGPPAAGIPGATETVPLADDPDLISDLGGADVPPGRAMAKGEGGGATGEMSPERVRDVRRRNEDADGDASRPARRGDKAGGGKTPDRKDATGVAAHEEQPAVRGRGIRFASIRGVFPFEKQARLMADALHMTLAQAADQVEIDDFVIERQRAAPGADPWSGKWEVLDYSTAIDVLDEVVDYAPDVVRTDVTNSTITMALPRRITGIWHVTRVGHPRLQEYLLDEDTKRQEEMKLNQDILDQARKLNLKTQKERRRPGRAKGFADSQRDLNHLRRAVHSAALQNSDVEDEMNRDRMRRRTNENPGGIGFTPEAPRTGNGPQGNRLGLSALIGSDPFAIPKLILFRYLDFTVEPGECYRYRVRLVFLNPNFGKPLDKVVSAEVAQSERLNSDWSEPTPPVFIKPDVQVFLAQVPRVRKTGREGAILDVFEWDPQFGTIVRAELKQFFGQSVGGRVKTEVADPFRQSLGAQEIVMRTRQILVDSLTIPPLPLTENPDLQIDPKRWDNLEKSGAFEEAVTVNRSGELENLIPPAMAADRQKAIHDTELQNRFFAKWRAAKEETAVATTGNDLDRELDKPKKNLGKGAAKGKNAKKAAETNPLKMENPGAARKGGKGGGGRLGSHQ